MELMDFLKRVGPDDMHRMMIYKGPDGGWCNINISLEGEDIVISPDMTAPFSDEQ